MALALSAMLAGCIALLGTAEMFWSLFSDKPLVPGVGRIMRSWLYDSSRVLMLVAIAGAFVFMLRIQLAIWRSTLAPDILVAPEGIPRLNDEWPAGADYKMRLMPNPPIAAHTVTFSARQGRTRIVKDQAGYVDPAASSMTIVLPFTGKETSKLRDGDLLVQARYVDAEGSKHVLPWVAIKAFGPLVN